jgi:antitoxin MazE
MFKHVDTYALKVYTCLNRQGIEMENTTSITIEHTIQEWGNGLGMRITAPLARAARIARGTPIKVEVVEGGFFVRVAGKPKLTLEQKLKAFDPEIHGGEVMASGRVGAEVF